MRRNCKIYVAGHNGLVGSSIVRELEADGYKNIITFDRKDLDLLHKEAVETMFNLYRPSYVFIAAAKVGGIHHNNTLSGEFFYENLMVQTNVMEAARKSGVKKLLFLGSSCIYPREAPQPIKEESLLTSPFEPTNSAYAVAKIAGIEMAKAYRKQYGCNYISVMPTNLYGIRDNFSLTSSHVLPALIRKFHDAKINGISLVELWGDGSPLREFLYIDDLAKALLLLMKGWNQGDHINVGSGVEVPIRFLSKMVAEIVGWKGEIIWNGSFPNGTPRKILDSSKIRDLGWEPEIDLETGISRTYEWFVQNYQNIRK